MFYFAPINILPFLLWISLTWTLDYEDIEIYEQGKEFCYSDPECGPRTWEGLCQTGKHQSPISLPSYAPVLPGGSQLHLGTYRANSFRIRNNGHSVQVEITNQLDSNGSKPIGLSRYRIDSYELAEYKLDSAHFHWGAEDNVGSEHEFDGSHRFSMELHLVHFRSNYSSTTAALKSTDSNAIAVIGIMLNATNSTSDNQYLAPLIQNLAQVNQPSQQWITVPTPIDFTHFLPNSAETNYMYTYKGSLTTPTCDEKVNWYVFNKPVQISQSDVQQFRILKNDNGQNLTENHRPIQPKNDRTVFLTPIASA